MITCYYVDTHCVHYLLKALCWSLDIHSWQASATAFIRFLLNSKQKLRNFLFISKAKFFTKMSVNTKDVFKSRSPACSEALIYVNWKNLWTHPMQLTCTNSHLWVWTAQEKLKLHLSKLVSLLFELGIIFKYIPRKIKDYTEVFLWMSNTCQYNQLHISIYINTTLKQAS